MREGGDEERHWPRYWRGNPIDRFDVGAAVVSALSAGAAIGLYLEREQTNLASALVGGSVALMVAVLHGIHTRRGMIERHHEIIGSALEQSLEMRRQFGRLDQDLEKIRRELKTPPKSMQEFVADFEKSYERIRRGQYDEELRRVWRFRD